MSTEKNKKPDSMRKVVQVLSRVGIYYLGDGSATKIHIGLDICPSSTGFFTSIYIIMLVFVLRIVAEGIFHHIRRCVNDN